MFHVGQLVVCVDDVPIPGYSPEMHGLTKGIIYTVRGFGIGRCFNDKCVYLKEIIRPIKDGHEAPFSMWRFRPVVETRLDVFREMLAPVPNVKQTECV